MKTRSAAKKFEGFDYVGDGIYVRTEPSATGLGTHTQWLYDNYQPPLTAHSNASTESFSSLFDGSLSSLSSSDESSGSCGSFSDIPDTRSPSDSAQLFNSYKSLLDFMDQDNPRLAARQARPVTPVKNEGRSPRQVAFVTPKNNNPLPLPTTPRPLKRTAHQRWEMNASGNLCPVVEKPTRSRDPQEIREREMKLLEQRHRKIQTSLWLGSEKDDMAMDFDAENMVYRGDSSNQNIVVASSSRLPQQQLQRQPSPKKLGPHGTEIIDENFRAPAGDASVYPALWVQNQSNGLRSFPTESCL